MRSREPQVAGQEVTLAVTLARSVVLRSSPRMWKQKRDFLALHSNWSGLEKVNTSPEMRYFIKITSLFCLKVAYINPERFTFLVLSAIHNHLNVVSILLLICVMLAGVNKIKSSRYPTQYSVQINWTPYLSQSLSHFYYQAY